MSLVSSPCTYLTGSRMCTAVCNDDTYQECVDGNTFPHASHNLRVSACHLIVICKLIRPLTPVQAKYSDCLTFTGAMSRTSMKGKHYPAKHADESSNWSDYDAIVVRWTIDSCMCAECLSSCSTTLRASCMGSGSLLQQGSGS